MIKIVFGDDRNRAEGLIKREFGSDYEVFEGENFRVHLLRHYSVFKQMMEKRPHYADFIEVGAMKIFADGSFGGSTAALLDPYSLSVL